MMGEKLISYCAGIYIVLVLCGCSSKQSQEQSFKLESLWQYDSITGDSVLRPMEAEFDEKVKSHLALIQPGQVPDFMFDIYLDSSYHGYKTEGSHGRSLRAAIIGQISDRKLLELMLSDIALNKIWKEAKRDSTSLRTNIEMATARLKKLDEKQR